MLPDTAVIEFQKIYQNEFKMSISFEQAAQRAEDFIQLYDLVTTKNENDKNEKLHNDPK